MAGDIPVDRYLASRERWVELDPGLAVRVRRPAEARIPALLQRGDIEAYAACVVGWRGFTGAMLLGAALASDTPAPFDPELWREVALDNVEWCNKIAEAVVQDCTAFLQARDDARKN